MNKTILLVIHFYLVTKNKTIHCQLNHTNTVNSKIKYFEQMIRWIFIIAQSYGIPALKQAYFLKQPKSGFLEPMAQKNRYDSVYSTRDLWPLKKIKNSLFWFWLGLIRVQFQFFCDFIALQFTTRKWAEKGTFYNSLFAVLFQ